MSGAARERPTERDLHAMIDQRLDRRRARELEDWLSTEALRDERFGGWKRGLDAVRAAYDPIVDESPPLYLSLAARASAAQAERAARAPIPALIAAPAPIERGGVARDAMIAVASFLIGAFAALILTAAARHFADPRHPGVLAAGTETLTTIWRLALKMF